MENLKFPNGTLCTTYNGAKVALWANATFLNIPFKLLEQNINSTGLSHTNLVGYTIKYNTAVQPSNANYLGYSIMTFLNWLYNLNDGVYNSIMSTVLPCAGTYDCDISLPWSCCAGSTADRRIQYCIWIISAGLKQTFNTK